MPFYDIPNDLTVAIRSSTRKKPARPSQDVCLTLALDDEMWGFIERCWAELPSERPTATEAVRYLSSRPGLVGDIPPNDWEELLTRGPTPDLLHQCYSLAQAYADFVVG